MVGRSFILAAQVLLTVIAGASVFQSHISVFPNLASVPRIGLKSMSTSSSAPELGEELLPLD
jgi:hypothetical protein